MAGTVGVVATIEEITSGLYRRDPIRCCEARYQFWTCASLKKIIPLYQRLDFSECRATPRRSTAPDSLSATRAASYLSIENQILAKLVERPTQSLKKGRLGLCAPRLRANGACWHTAAPSPADMGVRWIRCEDLRQGRGGRTTGGLGNERPARVSSGRARNPGRDWAMVLPIPETVRRSHSGLAALWVQKYSLL